MQQKKAQAAMEFLMTYGWALLVVLIAIGALAFFGVLNPSKFLPTQCILGPGFACEDFKVSSAGQQIKILVRNGLGSNLDLFAIHISKRTPTSNEMCGGVAGYGGGTIGAPINANEYFNDGELKLIRNGPGVGMQCDLLTANAYNCCDVFSTYFAASYYGGPIQLCDPTTDCSSTTSTPLTSAGSKFNEELVISYRVLGSVIMHQRIGRLTTQIE